MVIVIYTYLIEKKPKSFIEKNLHIFPNDFQKKIQRYHKWQDAQATILGRLLLLNGLNYFFNIPSKIIEIGYNNFGRPYLKRIPLDFNISHSGKMVVCAITDEKTIGVDVEFMKDIDIEEFRFQMTNSEYENIKGYKFKKDKFYTYWTQKEAIIKAAGEGFNIPLKSFEVIDESTVLYGTEYHVKELFLDADYKCHIAGYKKIIPKKMIVKYIGKSRQVTICSVNNTPFFRVDTQKI